jgi:hypothetical protein
MKIILKIIALPIQYNVKLITTLTYSRVLPIPKPKKPWKTLLILMGHTKRKLHHLKIEYQAGEVETQVASR